MAANGTTNGSSERPKTGIKVIVVGAGKSCVAYGVNPD
jgi:hypothetical protein